MVDASFSELTADRRFKQVAAILARGVRRFHHRLRRSQSRPENEVPESSPARLEVPGKPRLTVSRRIGV
ncbi:MAG: hypothetical protein KatS3mg082_2904 [Nitrospiraceae bacterium]|nr:MAG: hypothetical protein KatS3mg082_2678 [Nitrospiraceae bacterium]GIW56335.1 MAG: hypothetical protein KatS3mg082_2739 [Nitrospiraceae bacterium]GIW56500.1 MAG: hypothetical protein KatS3mg082_2904 [Nitrospiraceae bacterium]